MSGFIRGLPRVVVLFITVFTYLVAAAPWGTRFSQPSSVHITSLRVDLKVPSVPAGFPSDETIFIWPGVQPGTGSDPTNIGNGILTPSLTYGRSCAPGGILRSNSWWISGSYFNVPAQTQDQQYAGCHGGDVMSVEPGEVISCSIVNTEGSKWEQSCSRPNGRSVSYSIDMSGQQMNWASLSVHPGSDGARKSWSFPVFIYNYQFTTSAPMPSARCVVAASGDNYLAQGSTLSADGMTCSLNAIAFWNSEGSTPPITSIPSI